MIKPQKVQAILLQKEALSETTFDLTFKLLGNEAISFVPGQYANLLVGPSTWRSYSIVSLEDNSLKLIIDIKPGGPGSIFVGNLKKGDEVTFLLPLGVFSLKTTENPKIFISTGTGLVPFVPMLYQLLESGFKNEVKLFFGARHDCDDYALKFLQPLLKYPNFKLYSCLTKSELPTDDIKHKGRVNQVLFELGLDLPAYEFYICGLPQMVAETVTALKEKGAANIYFEKY